MDWTCDYCGEEIDHEGCCDDCQPVEEEEDDGYCTYCAGTGEGMYDGARCSACGGKGFVRTAPEFDEPDDDYHHRDCY